MSNKILVVDDDTDILDAMTLILESKHYQVITAINGLEALEKLEEGKPDLMILDLLMPKLDGFGVYKRLQEPKWAKCKDMPVLILTSIREDVSRRRYELETGKELAPDDYVEKPFAPDMLLKRVDRLIKKKQRA